VAEEPDYERRPPEPEPEGGPEARKKEFLAERTTRLRPRTAEDAEETTGAEPAVRGAFESALEEAAPPQEFRAGIVGRYRERQKAELDRKQEEAEAGEAEGAPETRAAEEAPSADDEPPQPPLPPPANNWVPIGPSAVRRGQGGTKPATSGRVLGIAVGSGGNRVYVASSNGGVWRSDDAGASWQSKMDAWDLNPTNAASDSLACGAIAIDPTNADRIFVGTGDGDEALYFGVGPVFSPDGGQNWFTEPVAAGSPQLAGSAFNALAVDPGNPDRVVAATFQGLYRREPAGAGFQWARKSTPSGAISSVVVARTGGTTTFFAAPWAGPVFSSADGNTWTQVGTGFPTSNVGRVGLAVQANNPNVLYALVAALTGSLRGIYRLDNMTGAWRSIAGAPADLFGPDPQHLQGSYDLAIAVDPNDANLTYVGGSTKWSGNEWSGSSYRCPITSSGSGSSVTYSTNPAYTGNSHHADVHTIVFAPGDSNKLWLGCDGGAFYSTNPTGSGDIFIPRNTGLQTLEMNRMAHHPIEDAVVFCGTQDNGGVRFTGEEAWYHSAAGDGGGFVVNWNDPYKVLSTYVGFGVRRSTDGGTRYNYVDVYVPAQAGDSALFYAPLAGTPPDGTAAHADRVAFGSRRPWISETFGGGWQSIPANAATDDLGSEIRSLRFASYTKLYAGTTGGRVYRFDQSGATWTGTRIDNAAGGPLGLVGPITSIAVDPADTTGNSIYITLGGIGDYRHVWHFDGTAWAQRSGPSAGNMSSLIDVQHNAVATDPANPGTVYVGADIGIWRSTNGGTAWAPLSDGLPDAAVLDVDLHGPSRLLRAATYGRGVFEYDLAATSLSGIQLYVRDTQLDQGRKPTVDWLPDPTAKGELVRHWRGPDIKLDTPDVNGNYQFPITAGTTIDFEQFDDELTDDFQNVATHATATIVTRVYVQVHNRGVTKADGVRVMLLLANASSALPNLPTGFAANVQSGTPINTPDWKTVGFDTVDDVRVGFPKIAKFDLLSSMLPPPANLAGNDHHCVLALIHHPQDQFTATQTVTDLLSVGERKAAHKNLKVVQFTGTLPPAAPPQFVVLPVRLNNPYKKQLVTSLQIDLGRYAGKVRLYLPKLALEGKLDESVEGAKLGKDHALFKRWAVEHRRLIKANLAGKHPYDVEWCAQRIDDVSAASRAQRMYVSAGEPRIEVKDIVMKAGSHATVFLFFERPPKAKIGTAFPIEIVQLDEKRKRLGGLSARVEIVPAPREKPVAPAPEAVTAVVPA
jgi:hypothetical protein